MTIVQITEVRMNIKKIMILLLCTAVFFSSCNNSTENEKKPNNDTSGSIFVLGYSFEELAQYASDVYEGTIKAIEKVPDGEKKKEKFTIEISMVFKGDYTIDQTIEEVFYYGRSRESDKEYYIDFEEMIKNNIDIKIGGRYLFMTGVDEKFVEYERTRLINEGREYFGDIEFFSSRLENKEIFAYSLTQILDDGSLKQITDQYDDSTYFYGNTLPPKNYNEMRERLVREAYQEYNGSIITYTLTQYMKGSDDIPRFFKACEMADNVYFGEIIDVEELGAFEGSDEFGNDILNFPLYSNHVYEVRVKVISVIKGDYKPGQIVKENCSRFHFCYDDNGELTTFYNCNQTIYPVFMNGEKLVWNLSEENRISRN